MAFPCVEHHATAEFGLRDPFGERLYFSLLEKEPALHEFIRARHDWTDDFRQRLNWIPCQRELQKFHWDLADVVGYEGHDMHGKARQCTWDVV